MVWIVVVPIAAAVSLAIVRHQQQKSVEHEKFVPSLIGLDLKSKLSILDFQYLQNRSEKMYVHALHALPDLRIAWGTFGGRFSIICVRSFIIILVNAVSLNKQIHP
ncbi:MAG: hypothetical protein QOI89_3227 [Solirubrobacteraceae bacterium]|nr:hypothetical protein [Solirubrobacteraceae bacterium]